MFQPETVKAGTYDNAYSFYQNYQNEMVFIPGAYNQGEIYYATKAKKDESAGIKYQTIGWQVRIFNSEQSLVETVYYKLGGVHMSSIDVRVVNGYEYCLYRVTLENLKSRLSQAGLRALENSNSNIIFDACTTTKIKGVLQGGMTDKGPEWGLVYTTYNGIVNAQKWTDATKETLKSYYNKTVDGLYYDVYVLQGTGISQVYGAGRYCFGTQVTVYATPKEGYHFLGWRGSHSSQKQCFSFVVYGNPVLLVADGEENRYKIEYDANGGQGVIPSQTYSYNQIITLPSSGFLLDGYALSGWSTIQKEVVKQYLKGESVSIKEVVHEFELQNKNNAIIRLFARWDKGPIIQADTIYVSLKEATSGKITEDWISQRIEAYDEEDGKIPYGKNKNNSFFIEDFSSTDFTNAQYESIFEKKLLAMDSGGNITTKNIPIYIVDTREYSADEFHGRVRFISKKYFKDESGNFIEEEKGGLKNSSIWRQKKEYQMLLEEVFQ